MTKRILCLLLTTALAAPAAAQITNKKAGQDKPDKPSAGKSGDLTDPIEILKQVDAATKKVKAVKYNARLEPDSTAAARFPKVQGSVTLTGQIAVDSRQLDKYLISFEAEIPGGSRVKGIVGSDADEFFFIDKAAKTAYVDIDPSVLGRRGAAGLQLGMIEFVHPSPFTDEINGKKQKLKGTKTVGGVACYEIQVTYDTVPEKSSIWCFGKKDFLPRSVVRIFNLPSGEEGRTTLSISDLKVDPKLEQGAFKVKVPEGFKKTDEPAP